MTTDLSPAREPAAQPAAAAQALSDAARAVAAAWEQPMEPDAYSRAVSQMYSVLRDLGIAIRGLARYQITPAPPGPPDRGFAQHVGNHRIVGGAVGGSAAHRDWTRMDRLICMKALYASLRIDECQPAAVKP